MKKTKLFNAITVGIPLVGYLSWMSLRLYEYAHLPSDSPSRNAIFLGIASSVAIAIPSVLAHVLYVRHVTKKYLKSMTEVQLMSERVQGMSEDLVEVASFHYDQIQRVSGQLRHEDPANERAVVVMRALRDAAEELSIRADKTAFDIQRLDKKLQTFFVNPSKKSSSRVRSFESSFYYR